MKDIGNALTPGAAAVFVLIAKMTEDKVIAELLPYGGQLLRSSLSTDQEEHLRDAVKTARAAMATR
jgi:uncharacterized membrane protein